MLCVDANWNIWMMPCKKNTTALLAALRNAMVNRKLIEAPVSAYIVPSGDSHQNEYIAPADCRREFISGFAGSAGTAVITLDKAALWVDGRYHLQADAQTDDNWLVMKDGLADTPTIHDWLADVLGGAECFVGADTDVVPSCTWKTWNKSLSNKGQKLVPVARNLIDYVWENKPDRPNNLITVHHLQFAGKSWQAKVKEVRSCMAKKNENITSCIFSALDDVAWLFNLRGSDIPYNPVFFSYAIVSEDKLCLYVNSSALSDSVRAHLSDEDGEVVQIYSYDDFSEHLNNLVERTSGKIWLSNSSSERIHTEIPEVRKHATDNSIVFEMKAVKNTAEIQGMKAAHIKDAVSLCEFYNWIEQEVVHNKITESEAADKLLEFKKSQNDFVSLSFDTISSSGPNAAVIHYKPIAGEDRVIANDSIYLLDSGGQYKDGTTDVTRTVHFGNPTSYQRECYTRVLKGFLALGSAVWPQGVKGFRLDCLARMHLWSVGLDYKHGTGHGVGAYLNVHEGPCSISYRSRAGEADLAPGMIVTDEPGYYEDGEFGIRIENCMLIKEAETKYNFKETGYLCMEPLTLVPISLKLIEPSLLTSQEIDYINSYHTRVRDEVSPLLKSQGKVEALAWLIRETQPIG